MSMDGLWLPRVFYMRRCKNTECQVDLGYVEVRTDQGLK